MTDRSAPDLSSRSPTGGGRPNLSAATVPLPPGEVLLSSAPLEDGRLGPYPTVWLGA
ncbi:hypothetical protein [Streptomyces viridochromogenes]|nr:hypothetical protein [Streptomyces viridochromogenes]